MTSGRFRPEHHTENGFRNPWFSSDFDSKGAILRWQWERLSRRLPPNPRPEQLDCAVPDLFPPRLAAGELRATWVGHASWLVQIGPFNVLTDPHWSERASPVPWAGPRRFSPPGIPFQDLPPIDAVLISHDHYDHLDAPTIGRLRDRFGDSVRWVTPLGYGDWFGRRGIEISEFDWWEERGVATREGADLVVQCLPAQHWTSRSPFDRLRRLWSSWKVVDGSTRVYFGGDSGWFPGYEQIGAESGPFDLLLLPVGAYEPRWFMRPAHMNPEEAVQAYQELGGSGVLGAMHWGTFRLTDEDPLEPRVRTRIAWARANLPEAKLWIPAHGESRAILAA